MPPHVTERSSASRYDGIEILTIGLGVLLRGKGVTANCRRSQSSGLVLANSAVSCWD